MKLKNLFLALMAGVAALVGCEPEVDYGPAKISINPETLTFSKADGAEEVTLLSTRDWMVTGTPDWIVLSASEGKGSVENQKVKVSVLANNGHNRSASLVFTIGYAKATLSIEQEGPEGKIETGSGTKEDPYTVAGVVAYVNELGGDVESPSKVYVKGKISRIASAGSYSESGTYGNATFYISDDGTQNNEFYCYRILYLGNEKFKSGDSDIKTGDDVVIYGKVVNFKGNTPETVQSSSFLFSLNGVDKGGDGGDADAGPMEGDGSQAGPFNVSAARNAVKDLTWTSNTVYQKIGPFYVKGKVKSIDENFSASFGNATFTMMDEGYEKATFIAYRILYLNNKKWANGDTALQVGDEVIICAELMNYRGNTPETVANSGYVYSLNGETGSGGGGNDNPGTPEGEGTQASPYNVAAALNAVKDLTWTSNTEYQSTDVVYMKGKISKIADKGTFGESGTYGNASFYITDEGTNNEFYCFRILYLGNAKYTSGTDIKVGDEVIICGKLMNYRGNTPETVANECYLYSLNGTTEAGGGGGGGGNDNPGTPEGEGTQASPYNVAAALNAVKDLTWTSNTEYQSTDVVYMKGKISRIANAGTFGESGTYGNASFYISDDGKESNEFYCFRILYLGNEKYTSGTDIQVGDDVVICGKLMNYKGNTPETVANEAYLYSLVSNGGSGGSGGGGEGGDPTVLYTDLSQVIALADNAVANFEGVVAAVTSNSFVVTDGTNNVYTFKPVTMAAIGDKVKVEGTKTTYGGIPEIAQGAKVTVLSSGNPVVYPEARVITSSFDSYTSSVSEFIEFTGTLAKSGNYYNVTVAGASAFVGSISFPVASLGLDALDGKEVVFKGYFVGMSGNPAKYVNLACVSAAATDGTIPGGGSDPGTGGEPGGGGQPGDEDGVFYLNSSASTWASDTDPTYGTGFSTTMQGVKFAYYKYQNNQNPVAPNATCIRVYKSAAFVITAPEGKTIKSLLFTADGADSGKYCVPLTTLEGGGTATLSADVSALTIGPWEGSAGKVVFQTAAGQARLAKVKVVME